MERVQFASVDCIGSRASLDWTAEGGHPHMSIVANAFPAALGLANTLVTSAPAKM